MITIVVVAVLSRAWTTMRFQSAWMNAAARTMASVGRVIRRRPPGGVDYARAAVGAFETTSSIRSSASLRFSCEFA